MDDYDAEDAAYERKNAEERASMREDELRDEIERLRAEAADDDVHAEWDAKLINDLAAERDRLRAALERVRHAKDLAEAVHIAHHATVGAESTGSGRRCEFPRCDCDTHERVCKLPGSPRAAAPASEAPEITQLCPKCNTGWTARELLPCPECGYTFPSRPDDAPETEEMRLLTALVSVRPGCATFDRLMREATAFVARVKLQGDCQHCGGHPGGVDGHGKPCPACGSPGLHRSDCAVNNGSALPVKACDCGASDQPSEGTKT